MKSGRRSGVVLLAATLLLAASTAPAQKASDGPPAEGGEAIALFDGHSLDGWTTGSGEPVTSGWAVEDGVMARVSRGGAIYAEGEYEDFILDFVWRIESKGNGGIKYRVRHYEKGVRGHPGWLGCEYQLLDDAGRNAESDSKSSAGALYSLYGPNRKKQLKPLDEFNHSRIVVHGTRIEHWLNGRRIVKADTESRQWKKRIAQSKFAPVEDFALNRRGRIQLQDHGGQVWFQSITLRPLAKEEPSGGQ